MFLLIFPITWIAAVVGRRLCRRVLGDSAQDSSPLEMSAFGAAVGLGILAYGVMALGLSKVLELPAILLWIVVLAIIGWGEHALAWRDLITGIRSLRFSWTGCALAAGFIFFGLVAVVGCFTPPTGMEWDSLAYHLADPKIYLHYGRLLYLPWESHSNFAFTTEMLYTIGLALHSVALAKAFHLTLGALSVAAVYLIGARHINSWVGKGAALLFASVPLVFWEAGTAYVDLAAVALGTLGLLALLNGFRREGRRWFWVCALTLGLMLSVKATSLVTLVLVCAWIAGAMYRAGAGLGHALRQALLVGILGVVIGCPWYVKSAAYTGNPVYPFAYGVFGGKDWNAVNAAAYNHDQQSFGVGRRGENASRLPRLSDLLISPWNIIMYSMPGHIAPLGPGGKSADLGRNPFNDFPTPYVSLSPFLLSALFAPVFLRSKLNRVAAQLGLFSLASLVIWFFLTQQIRYLLPVVAPVCILCVSCMDALLRERKASGYTLAIVYLVSMLGSVAIGVVFIEKTAPVAAGGVVEKGNYILSGLPSYDAMQFLNELPPGSRVVFYGEPRDFYCNQPYMLGDAGTVPEFPPYRKLGSSQALMNYFRSHEIRYVLVNATYFQTGASSGWAGMVNGVFALRGVTLAYENDSATIKVYQLW